MPANVRKSGRGEGEIMSLVGDDRDLTHPSTTWVPYLGLPYLLLVNSLHRSASSGWPNRDRHLAKASLGARRRQCAAASDAAGSGDAP
jgi:hypothetical protein